MSDSGLPMVNTECAQSLPRPLTTVKEGRNIGKKARNIGRKAHKSTGWAEPWIWALDKIWQSF